jgi:hypothetical protein
LRKGITADQVAQLRRTLLARLAAVPDLVIDADKFEVDARRDLEYSTGVRCEAIGFPPTQLPIRDLVHGLLEDSVALWLEGLVCDYLSIDVRMGHCSQTWSNPRHQSPDQYARIIQQLAARITRYAAEEYRAQAVSPEAAGEWHQLVSALVCQIQELLDRHVQRA